MQNAYSQFNIESLELTNFRCFNEFSVHFNLEPRTIFAPDKKTTVGPLTVLVAKNGMGKTSLLDAIRILFGTYTSSFSPRSKKTGQIKSAVHANQSDIHLFRKDNGFLSQANGLSIHGNVCLGGKPVSVSRELLQKEGSRTTTKGVSRISHFGNTLVEKRGKDKRVSWPLIAYYGTGRLWSSAKTTERTLLAMDSAAFGYDNCLGEHHSFKAVRNWLTKAISKRNIESADNLRQNHIMESQIQAVSNSLRCVLSPQEYLPELTIESLLDELAIKQLTSDGIIPVAISQLSDGVRIVFSLVADIAFRCAKLNPHLGENAAQETQGIILIDEVDLHLHPAWQQKILNALQLSFPNLQFIVTTHSPQVVSSVPRECVRIIDPKQEQAFLPDGQTEGATAQRMLNDVFGTPSRLSPNESELTAALKRYRNLIAHGMWDSPEAENVRAFLQSVMSTDPELAELEMTIRLKDYQRRHSSETNP